MQLHAGQECVHKRRRETAYGQPPETAAPSIDIVNIYILRHQLIRREKKALKRNSYAMLRGKAQKARGRTYRNDRSSLKTPSFCHQTWLKEAITLRQDEGDVTDGKEQKGEITV